MLVQADRDRDVELAQATRDWMINGDITAQGISNNKACEKFDDTTQPAGRNFNRKTAIADGRRVITEADADLAFSLAAIQSDLGWTTTTGERASASKLATLSCGEGTMRSDQRKMKINALDAAILPNVRRLQTRRRAAWAGATLPTR